MQVIYKYPVLLVPFVLQLPYNAKPLTVQMQNTQPVMWVQQETKADKLFDRHFQCFWTGEKADLEHVWYIGTFQHVDGLVYHLYETEYDLYPEEHTKIVAEVAV